MLDSKLFDHTILKADATEGQVQRVCAEARDHGFASVCVNSFYTAFVAEELRGSGVKTCTVVGFPLGQMSTRAKRVVLKVIIETCLLSEEEKIRACHLAKKAGADFVKTSTGFSTGGATVEDVRLMRETVGDSMGVKASGGIHTREMAEALAAAGANRLGTSATLAIVEEKS